jgi:hypothetical protein
MNTKAKIDIKNGIVELEGSEPFVVKFLDYFKERIESKPIMPAAAPTVRPTNSDTKEEAITLKKPSPISKRATNKSKSKNIQPERFDIHGSEKAQSLEKFLQEKKPGTGAGEVILVMGYYITELLHQPFFTEGNIEYAYRTLNIKGRPTHLRQIIINNKNQKDYFEEKTIDQSDEKGWSLTRTGKIYVEDKLPNTES